MAEFFGVSTQAVDGWIRRGCPCVQRGGQGRAWVFDLLEVAKWRFGVAETKPGQIDPEDLSPKERLDWYKGNRERDAHAKEQDVLIPFDLLDQLLGAAFAELRGGLLSQHNAIAAEFPEIPTDAIRRILAANRDLLARLAQTRLPQPVVGALDALAEDA